MYLVKSPFFLKWYYPNLVWNKSRREKIIYLTFDDGPIPIVTEFVLKTLSTYNAKATFFCIGDNIEKHAEVFNAVLKAGHSIGNHTFNHLNGWKTDDKIYIKNVLKAQALIQTNLFRPPYGRIKKAQIKMVSGIRYQVSGINSALNLKFHTLKLKPNTSNLKPHTSIIMWDVLSGDFDINLSPEKCYQNVINNARNGSIVVFHDSLKAFERLKYALPKVLEYFALQGFRFERL